MMPNGDNKNYIRLCGAIDGFKLRFLKWPTRVVAYPMCIEDLRDHVLSPNLFQIVTEKIELVEGNAGFRAEDNDGNIYDYGSEGFPDKSPTPSAQDWLGIAACDL
jgi:hypothetical protein